MELVVRCVRLDEQHFKKKPVVFSSSPEESAGDDSPHISGEEESREPPTAGETNHDPAEEVTHVEEEVAEEEPPPENAPEVVETSCKTVSEPVAAETAQVLLQEPEPALSEIRTEETKQATPENSNTLPKRAEGNVEVSVVPESACEQGNDVQMLDVAEPGPVETSSSSEACNQVEDSTAQSKEKTPVVAMIQVKSEPGTGRSRDPSQSRWAPQVKTEPTDTKFERGDGSEYRGVKRERSRSPSREQMENDEKTHEYWSKQEEEAKQPSVDDLKVVLDSYNSDLNLTLESGYQATPLTKEGFAFVWAGARASFGLKTGKACYEVKIIEQLDVSHLPPDEVNPHVVRVGFSCEHTSMQLGEEAMSYGYGGTGKASVDCKFRDFGIPFAAGDVVTAFIDMDKKPVEIAYAVNGKHVGCAFRIGAHELRDMALYPHILTKNCSFKVNFGQEESPYFPFPQGFQDYTFIGNMRLESLERGTKPPTKKSDCEMLMMCGLPGCGKTTWAEDFCQKHPEKKYNVLGTNSIIDKMKVMGLPRKRNYHGRWEVLIQLSTKCLNTLFTIGSKKLRNYILDQTNVYPSAQRRKMSSFAGFRRLAVVIVPTDEEFLRRCAKRDKEEGKEIPDSAVLEMKANFGLPHVGDLFDEVIFTDLPREEAQKLVKQYNEEGQAVFPPNKKFRPNDSRGRGGQNFSPRRSEGGSDRRDSSRDSYDSRDGRGWRGDSPRGGRGGGNGRFPRGGGFGGGRGGGRDWQQRSSPSFRDGDRDRDRDRGRGGRGGSSWGPPRRGGGGGDWRNNSPGGGNDWRNNSGGGGGADWRNNRGNDSGDWRNNRGNDSGDWRNNRGNDSGDWRNNRGNDSGDWRNNSGSGGGSDWRSSSGGGSGGGSDWRSSSGGGGAGAGGRDSWNQSPGGRDSRSDSWDGGFRGNRGSDRGRGGYDKGGRGGDRGGRGGDRGGGRGGGRGFGDRGGGGGYNNNSRGSSRPYQQQGLSQQQQQPQQQQWGQQQQQQPQQQQQQPQPQTYGYDSNSSQSYSSSYGQGYNSQQSYTGYGQQQQSYSQQTPQSQPQQQQAPQTQTYGQTQYGQQQQQQPQYGSTQQYGQTTAVNPQSTTGSAQTWGQQSYQQPQATGQQQTYQQQSSYTAPAAGQYAYGQQQQSYYGQK